MTDDVGGIAGDRLKSFIERIEALEVEKGEIGDSIKDVKDEAKGAGFSVPIINEIVKLRKMDRDAMDEHMTLMDLYMRALGMTDRTPLEIAADLAGRGVTVSVTAHRAKPAVQAT